MRLQRCKEGNSELNKICQSQESELQSCKKEVLKRFGTENNDSNKVCGHLYLSPPLPPHTHLPSARHTLKYSNRGVGRDTASWIQMADALNANAFSLSCCYQFIFSIWVLKRQIEVGRCPSATPRLPPGGRKAVRSQGNFRFPHTPHQGHLNTSQTAPIMPHCWQT